MDATEIRRLLEEAGAYKSGIARAGEVDAEVLAAYSRWLSTGSHASMTYLERYTDIRRDPTLLLPGAKSVVSSVFNYWWGKQRGPLQWASYALGDDYHDVVRRRLQSVADRITAATGAECRVCVDTAPILERYWAVRSGIGFVGRNRQLIVPGAGSRFFIGEIVTTLDLSPDEPCTLGCLECRRCISACPGGALTADGLDANRCLSYLTIEHRGDFPSSVSPACLGRRVYGCDVCQDVCPHNAESPISAIEEFRPRGPVLSLDTEAILSMSQTDFSTIFRRSAIKRTKLVGLQRNAAAIVKNSSGQKQL